MIKDLNVAHGFFEETCITVVVGAAKENLVTVAVVKVELEQLGNFCGGLVSIRRNQRDEGETLTFVSHILFATANIDEVEEQFIVKAFCKVFKDTWAVDNARTVQSLAQAFDVGIYSGDNFEC